MLPLKYYVFIIVLCIPLLLLANNTVVLGPLIAFLIGFYGSTILLKIGDILSNFINNRK